MTNTLEVRGLTIRYGSGANAITAVDGVDLTVPTGQTLGLVGESGCGKSSIARALMGLIPIAGGSIRLNGTDYSAETARHSPAYRRRVQMVFQDPYASLNPRMSIGECLREAVSMRGDLFPDSSAQAAESIRLLDLVGLPSRALGRYPHQFSGGQRQRIAIARALAVQPELLISDEATSALDVSVQATILNLLNELQRNLGISCIFITHDLSVVKVMSRTIAVMYLGQVVETTDTEALFANPAHPYTAGLLASVPRLAGIRRPAPLAGDLPDPRHPPLGCRFHTRCPIGPLANVDRRICVDEDPQSEAASRSHHAACHFAPPVSISLPEAG